MLGITWVACISGKTMPCFPSAYWVCPAETASGDLESRRENESGCVDPSFLTQEWEPQTQF